MSPLSSYNFHLCRYVTSESCISILKFHLADLRHKHHRESDDRGLRPTTVRPQKFLQSFTCGQMALLEQEDKELGVSSHQSFFCEELHLKSVTVFQRTSIMSPLPFKKRYFITLGFVLCIFNSKACFQRFG